MSILTVEPIQTGIFHPGGDLQRFVEQHISPARIREGMMLAVTSKIVSLAENRLESMESIDKPALVKREADIYMGEVAYGCHLTIKHGLLIPSAGIDESNSEGGDYILYPVDPFASARALWEGLRRSWGISNLGILLTDSHTAPLRRGVTGICLAWCGFRPVRDLIGTQDLFGRELRMTQINLADAWSAAAVVMMGEGRERCPLAILTGAEAEFCDGADPTDLSFPPELDLYEPMLTAARRAMTGGT